MTGYETGKRTMDVVIAAALLVALMPVGIAIAVLVRLSSPGPVLYAGRRVGKDGEVFQMYKFRSMRNGADREGTAVTGAGDPRVTTVGRFLRATKLDELPQLLNVLRGEMSLVGPRPEAPRYVSLYDERQRGVLAVRPGVTGPTQLQYRHEERLLAADDVEELYCDRVLPRKLEMDLIYVETRSLRNDVQCLLATAGKLFAR